MSSSPRTVSTVEDWAHAIVALTAPGPSSLARGTARFDLPQRTVLVPNERVAHTLRRTLLEQTQQAALAGTRFMPLLELARRILANAGELLTVNDAELTPSLIREALSHVNLERFDPRALLQLPGWDHAFAATIRELEAAALAPTALLDSEDANVRDVGRLFSLVSQRADRVSASTLLQRAAALVTGNSNAHSEPTLVVLTGFETVAELRLLRALPQVRWAVSPLRPFRADYLAKLRALHGDAIAQAFAAEAPSPAAGSSLSVLRARLFSTQLTDTAADDSAQVVTYAGVHEEVGAAVGWVVEQILEHGIAAQDIALVSPTPDGYTSLLSARLRALPWPDDTVSSYVERGLPLVERADGARLLGLLRALREGLPRELLAGLLPWLKGTDVERKIGNLSRAWTLLNAVGWTGGDRSHLEGGLGWQRAWQRAIARLQIPRTASGGLAEEQVKAVAGMVQDLSLHSEAILHLTQLLSAVVEEHPLESLWTQLKSFLASSFRLPPGIPPLASLMEEAVSLYAAHGTQQLAGASALEWLEEALLERMVSAGRFGSPAVYIGSLAGIRGLRFRAVRVLGLVEGSLPSAVREDPVLPDAARATLSPQLATSRTRAHRQLASFDCTLHATSEKLVLSAPRISSEGSARQPAAVLLDVMRALGAPASKLEKALEHSAAQTRRHERRQRDVLAVSASARLSRVAAGDRQQAEGPAVTSLSALRAITRRSFPGAHDGLLAGIIPRERLPGLSAEKPISASRLATLLSCPHRYLLENVLGWKEAVQPAPGHTLDALSFGILLHEVAEQFWLEHGKAIGARQGDLTLHQQTLRSLACQKFTAFRAAYPFVSDSVADAQQQELCDQLDKLLAYDWQTDTPRPFVAVERGFGYDQACALETAAGQLHVRGNIDRLDLEGDTLLVRDLKSGKSKPRRANAAPEVGIDLQLGLYARVASQLSASWHTPAKVAVAYVYLRTGELERRWAAGDYTILDAATDRWLATALQTLESGAFVRSPSRDDCTFCPHKPVCHGEHERTAQVLEHELVPARLRELKRGAP